MRFYMLKRPPRRDDRIPLDVTEQHLGCVLVDCSLCGAQGILPACLSPRVPVEVWVQSLGYLDDIEQAFTTLLASRKFRDAVLTAGLTGIEFYAPLGYKVKSNKPSYHKLVGQARDEFQFKAIYVTGRGGSVAQSSGVTLEKSCDQCGWRAWTLPDHGYHIDENRWDGSDFFYVDEGGPLFMTERAVEVLRTAGLSNFGAVPAEDYRPL